MKKLLLTGSLLATTALGLWSDATPVAAQGQQVPSGVQVGVSNLRSADPTHSSCGRHFGLEAPPEAHVVSELGTY